MKIRTKNSLETQSFYSAYHKTFEIIPAQTGDLKDKALQLRHDVYAVENDFEPRAEDGLDIDRFDDRAVHFLLMHKESNKAVGTVRVLLPDQKNLQGSFPIQRHHKHKILHEAKNIKRICQISRLCMSADFRRRSYDGHILPSYSPPEIFTGHRDGNLTYIRRRIPYAPLGLFKAAFETALKAGILNCVAMIEISQLQNFEYMGIAYKVLDKRSSYHGGQQPVLFNIKTVFDNMLLNNPDCWETITDKGRLHRMANSLYQTLWEDSFLETKVENSILDFGAVQ